MLSGTLFKSAVGFSEEKKHIFFESVSFHHEMFHVTSPRQLYCPCGDFYQQIFNKLVQDKFL